jgi:hypothetical protein
MESQNPFSLLPNEILGEIVAFACDTAFNHSTKKWVSRDFVGLVRLAGVDTRFREFVKSYPALLEMFPEYITNYDDAYEHVTARETELIQSTIGPLLGKLRCIFAPRHVSREKREHTLDVMGRNPLSAWGEEIYALRVHRKLEAMIDASKRHSDRAPSGKRRRITEIGDFAEDL